MNITMDFTTFLAVCAVVAGVGSFGIAVLRSRRNSGNLLSDESGQMEISIPKVYSIVREKIQEFYKGTCKSERSATREVIQAEMKGMKRVLETEIKQVNDTLTIGLKNIEREIRNNGNSDTGSEPDQKV